MWPDTQAELVAEQQALAARTPGSWEPPPRPWLLGGCWVCFPRGLAGPGDAGDPAWTAAVTTQDSRVVSRHTQRATAAAAYRPGLMALRVGRLLESVVRGLPRRPDVLLLDATGRDHPRRCGLATHLGAVLELPTVGVTHRPLEAVGDWPEDRARATSPLWPGEEASREPGGEPGGEEGGEEGRDAEPFGPAEPAACWLRTRAGTRPLVVHPGWRTDLATAVRVVEAALAERRTPEPLRQARHFARRARAADQGI